MKITCNNCGFVRNEPFCPECDPCDPNGEVYSPRYDGLEGLTILERQEAREALGIESDEPKELNFDEND